ncbi:MAG: hypothetical protein ACI4I9_01755 [Porcipelethomonas sp.]
MAFLDENGLGHLWSKIKALVSTKVDKAEGKGLSTNDYTNEDKQKLDGLSEITVDTKLSGTSTNPVQNKVIYAELEKKLNSADVTAITDEEIDAIIAGEE